MVFRRDALCVMATLLTFMLVSTSRASADTPTAELRGQVDQVLKALQDPELKKESRAAERRNAIRDIAAKIFDFEETAKRALGPHWRQRTPEEQREFVKLFTDLLEHSYIGKLEQYHGEKIRYASESIDGDNATVRTVIVTPKGSEVPVDYRMLRQNNGWRVYDVVIENVSLVGNYRTQFNKVIQTASYQELVEKLKSKAFASAAGRS